MSHDVCKHCGRSIPCAPGEEWKDCCPVCFAKNQASRMAQLEADNEDLKHENHSLLKCLAEAEAAKANVLADYNELLKKQL